MLPRAVPGTVPLDVLWAVWQCFTATHLCVLRKTGTLLLAPSMAPMWHPTFAVTWVFHGYVLLAPQLVYQDWLTACRSSAPHSSADTGTPHSRSRFSQYILAGQTVHSSRLSLARGYHGPNRLCWPSFQVCCCGRCRFTVVACSLCGFLPCSTSPGATHGGLPPVLYRWSFW